MSRRRKRSYTLGDGDEAEPNAVGMSGWLFTDLLLALLVVFAGAITISVATDDDNKQVLLQEKSELQEKLDEKKYELVLLENEKIQEMKNLQDKIAELEAKIVELQAENKELQLRIVELETEISELQAENTELQLRIVELETEISELQAENTELQLRILELETENARLGERNIEQCWYSVIIEGVPITTEEITPAVANNIKEQIRYELDKPGRIDRKVGLAFLFGAGENGFAGKKLSRVLKSLIEEYDFSEYPEFNESFLRPFWSGSAQANEVEMNLHFFTSSNSTKQDRNIVDCKTE